MNIRIRFIFSPLAFSSGTLLEAHFYHFLGIGLSELNLSISLGFTRCELTGNVRRSHSECKLLLSLCSSESELGCWPDEHREQLRTLQCKGTGSEAINEFKLGRLIKFARKASNGGRLMHNGLRLAVLRCRSPGTQKKRRRTIFD